MATSLHPPRLVAAPQLFEKPTAGLSRLSMRRGKQVMQTRCPKCTTIVRSKGGVWEILNGACLDLLGTEWKDKPEFCPTLSQVVEPEVVLPGITCRASVQEGIGRADHQS